MLLRRIKKLKKVPSQNMSLHTRDNPLKSLSLHAVIVASAVTSDPIVHNCEFRRRRSRRNNQRRKHQALDLQRHIKLHGISSNNINLFLSIDRVASPKTTNRGTSRKSCKSLSTTMSMKG
jgi:hypothetical protein